MDLGSILDPLHVFSGFEGPSTKMTSTMDPWIKTGVYYPFTREVMASLWGTNGQGGAFTGGEPNWVYPGQRIAPESPIQGSAFNWAQGLPGMTGSYQDMATQAAQSAAQPLDFNPLLANATNLWQRTIMPSIMERQAGMDAANSGGTTEALSRGGQDLASNLFAQMVPLELQARQQQLGAAAQFQNIGQMPLNALQLMDTLGTTQRGIGQQQLTADQMKFQESLPWSNPATQWLSTLLSNGELTPQAMPASLGYSLLTGAAQNMGPIIAAMSDAGMKENIKPVESARAALKALKAYTYNFKGDQTPRVGIMAQDVERVLPIAVLEKDGVKYVDIYAILSLVVNALNEREAV